MDVKTMWRFGGAIGLATMLYAAAGCNATAGAGAVVPPPGGGAWGTTISPQQGTPIGGSGAPGGAVMTPAPGSQAGVATGAAGTLTRDNAEAFVEAFEFSLAQVGRPKTFTAAEREQLITELSNKFSRMSATEQTELSKARATWNTTKAGWAGATLEAKQEFVTGVLVLAVGQQAAAQLTGQTSGGTQQASTGGDPWAAEAREKCENGSFEDKMFYCYGVQTPSVPFRPLKF